MKKKEATGAVSYVMLFTMALLMVIITFYLLSVAKLMSIQHDVDDAWRMRYWQALWQTMFTILRPMRVWGLR